jgi:hypothetical protein
MNNDKASSAQLTWELLNAAMYDIEKGNPDDAINAIAEAIQILEGMKK